MSPHITPLQQQHCQAQAQVLSNVITCYQTLSQLYNVTSLVMEFVLEAVTILYHVLTICCPAKLLQLW